MAIPRQIQRLDFEKAKDALAKCKYSYNIQFNVNDKAYCTGMGATIISAASPLNKLDGARNYGFCILLNGLIQTPLAAGDVSTPEQAAGAVPSDSAIQIFADQGNGQTRYWPLANQYTGIGALANMYNKYLINSLKIKYSVLNATGWVTEILVGQSNWAGENGTDRWRPTMSPTPIAAVSGIQYYQRAAGTYLYTLVASPGAGCTKNFKQFINVKSAVRREFGSNASVEPSLMTQNPINQRVYHTVMFHPLQANNFANNAYLQIVNLKITAYLKTYDLKEIPIA